MAKLFATVNSAEGAIELERPTPSAPWALAGGDPPELVRTGPATYTLVYKGRSHRVLVLKEDAENNTVRLRIGTGTYTVRLQDDRGRMLRSLGLDKATQKVREIKAPMPGLVINVLVQPGDAVKKNDPVLVLEAMKMENVIKSPGEGVVSKIHAEKSRAVEKGQLLVSFD
jgi:biotin carboxyl carrier protein